MQLRCLLLSAALALSCANPLNQATFDRYAEQGYAAKQHGDLAVAEESFRRALINARLGKLGPEREAWALYEYALVKRDRCDLEGAEAALKESLALADAAGASDAFVMKRLSELSQLYIDWQRYADALPVMERATEVGARLRVGDSEPGPYGEFLAEYATALLHEGYAERAQQIRTEADGLRKRAASAGHPPGREHPLFGHPTCPAIRPPEGSEG